MVKESILRRIQSFYSCIETNRLTAVYLFGSATNNEETFADIDLLVVYDDFRDASHVRAEIYKMFAYYPIDMIFMTDDEEAEFDFINSENCLFIANSSYATR